MRFRWKAVAAGWKLAAWIHSRIAELLAPFLVDATGGRTALSEAQLKQISDYLELLLRWNQKIGLTSVGEPENIVTRHFGESLFAAAHLLGPGSREAIIDVGSGAGFPGLPMKIYSPDVALTLIESNQKKAAFLKETVRVIDATGVTVFAGRAEEFTSRGDLVTLRAVERFESALQISANLVAPSGRLALLVGSPQVGTAKKLLHALSWNAPVSIPQSSQRVLLVGTSSKN